ncbi:hypothetical protein [Euzebya tangerina]|uniref:hypothetical protein n=1 Tax=Euzebya tangerina TaxID=591198 RepID=UPI0013C334E5|nr:hypothetical protein [Euzebya tangerina]
MSDPTCAEPAADTPFDAALGELLRAWRAWDDVQKRGSSVPLPERTAAFIALDDARRWVGAFDGAGRQPGWPGRPPGPTSPA